MGCAWMRFYLGLFFLTFSPIQTYAQACAPGWFGSHCQFKCHCENNNCKPDGSCLFGSSCAKGWFGPKCQYVDLTFKMASSTSPGWLYDGDNQSCSPGTEKSPIEVTLTEQVPFTWLRIHVTNSNALDTIQVQLMNNNNLEPCEQKSVTVDALVKDVLCEQQVIIDKVRLSGDVNNLCSVFISGGRNVALKQDTHQSSTYSGISNSSNAVDGNINGQYPDGSCTQTSAATPNPTWTVKFPKPQMINRYVIYNRNDGNADRLQGFLLTGYDVNQNQVFRHKDQETSVPSVYNIIATSAGETSPISSVTITGYQNEDILTICEFEAYGDCIAPNYGLDCEHICSEGCASVCSVTGQCSPCLAGWQGPRCDTACSPTTYGPGCTVNCSSNCTDQLCDDATGICNACPSGRTGDFCSDDCPSSTFGLGCSSFCNSSCVDQECDEVSGKCKACPPGMKGDFCDQASPDSKDEALAIGIGVGIGGLVIVGVVVTVLAMFCYLRTRHPNRQPSRKAQRF